LDVLVDEYCRLLKWFEVQLAASDGQVLLPLESSQVTPRLRHAVIKTLRNHGFHLRAWRKMSLVCCSDMLLRFTDISERQEGLEYDAV
jgi:hypothetical protein